MIIDQGTLLGDSANRDQSSNGFRRGEKKLKISSLAEDKGSPIVEQSRAWIMESTSGKSGSVSDGSWCSTSSVGQRREQAHLFFLSLKERQLNLKSTRSGAFSALDVQFHVLSGVGLEHHVVVAKATVGRQTVR